MSIYLVTNITYLVTASTYPVTISTYLITTSTYSITTSIYLVTTSIYHVSFFFLLTEVQSLPGAVFEMHKQLLCFSYAVSGRLPFL